MDRFHRRLGKIRSTPGRQRADDSSRQTSGFRKRDNRSVAGLALPAPVQLSSLLLIDGHFVVQTEIGPLLLLKVNARKFEEQSYWRIEQGPCCVNEIDIENGLSRVLRLNETHHLETITV